MGENTAGIWISAVSFSWCSAKLNENLGENILRIRNASSCWSLKQTQTGQQGTVVEIQSQWLIGNSRRSAAYQGPKPIPCATIVDPLNQYKSAFVSHIDSMLLLGPALKLRNCHTTATTYQIPANMNFFPRPTFCCHSAWTLLAAAAWWPKNPYGPKGPQRYGVGCRMGI